MKPLIPRRGWIVLLLLLCLCTCQPKPQEKPMEREAIAKLRIESTVFEEGGTIPKKYTCDGENISPPLSWSTPPEGTKSLALICEDPDAPGGIFVHWVLFGLSPDISALPEGVPGQETVLGGARQGTTSFGRIGYGGPCPPSGPAHRYVFTLYALDFQPPLHARATKQEVLQAMEGHSLAQGQLMGRYSR